MYLCLCGSPVHLVAVVSAVGDHDVPVLRHSDALRPVERAREGVDEGEEGSGRVEHLRRRENFSFFISH